MVGKFSSTLGMALLPLLVSLASAQESLPDILNRLEQHRSGIQSYVARVTIVRYSTMDYGPPVGEFRGFSIREIGAVADHSRDLMFECTSDYSGEASKSEPSFVVLRRGNQFWRSRGSRLVTAERDSVDKLMDPRVVGLGFCAEINRYSSFEEVLGNYRNWPAGRSTPAGQNGELANIGLLTFNLSQGYSPVRTGAAGAVTVRCQNTKTDTGIWLPEHAFYECSGSNGMYIHVEWLSINKPISPTIFTPTTVAKLCGLEFENRTPNEPATIKGLGSPSKAGKSSLSPLDRWGGLEACSRNVYQQMWLSRSNQLGPVSEEQTKLAEEILDENRTDYPTFNLLIKTTDSVESFSRSLSARLRKSDLVLDQKFRELLLPKQRDLLFGRYIVVNGLRAFANRAIQDRIGMTEAQQTATMQRLDKQRLQSRQLWSNSLAYEKLDPTLAQMDLRASAKLPAIRDVLSAEQIKIVEEMTGLVLSQPHQRLSFNF